MADDLSSDARPFKPNRQITRRDLGGEDPHKMRHLDNKLASRAQRKQIQLLTKLPLKKEKQKKKKVEKQKMRLLEAQTNREVLNEYLFGMLNLKEKFRLKLGKSVEEEAEEEEVEEKEPEIFGNWDALPDQIVKKILNMAVDDFQTRCQLNPLKYYAPPKLKRRIRRNYLAHHRKALEFAKLSGVCRRFYRIINNSDNKFPRFPVGMKIRSPIEGQTFAPERYQVYIYGGLGMKNPCQMVAAEDLVNCYRPCHLEDLLIIGRVTLNQRLMNALLKMDISKVPIIKFLDIKGVELQDPVGNIRSFLENAMSLKQFEFSGFSSKVEINLIFLHLKDYIESRGIECTPEHYSMEEMRNYEKENKHYASLREQERKNLKAGGYILKPKRKPKRKPKVKGKVSSFRLLL